MSLSLLRSAADPPSTIAGLYRLVRYDLYGDNPIGRLGYDEAGRMWVMLRPAPRAIQSHTAALQGREALFSYYGAYQVHEAEGCIVHFVEAASDPELTGRQLVRWYSLQSDRLTLGLDPEFRHSLIWQRIEAPHPRQELD